MRVYDFKVASAESLAGLLDSDWLDLEKFRSELVKKVREGKITNNQYTILHDAIMKVVMEKKKER